MIPISLRHRTIPVMVLILTFCINVIQAQGIITGTGWTYVSPFPFGGDFNDIEIIDASNIIACANYGIIMRSTDGGRSWTQTATPANFTDHITHVEFFSDGLNGYAVGGGQLLSTVDGGMSWQFNNDLDSHTFQSYTSEPLLEFQNSSTNLTLNSVFFVDGVTGWAAGEDGIILHTADAGITWSEQISGINETILDIQFVDSKVGWAAGIFGTILRTVDAGVNWVEQSSGITNLLFDSHFYDRNTGWVVGVNQKILKTTDGGVTWNPQSAPTNNRNLQAIHFVDEMNGWIAGDNSVVLKTTNGGEYWFDRSPNINININSVFFSDELNGWGAGESGMIIRSIDGGITWSVQGIETGKDLESVNFINSSKGWVVGSAGAFFRTGDSGGFWSEYQTGLNERLMSVHFPGSDIGWMAGEEGRILKFSMPKFYKNISAADNHIISISESNDKIYVSFMAELNSFEDLSNVVAFKDNPGAVWKQAVIMPEGSLKLEGLHYPFQWGVVSQYGRGYIFEDDQVIIFTDGRIKSITSIPGTNDFLFLNDSLLNKNTMANVLGHVGSDPRAVHAVNDLIYYTAGDSIFRTQDGGYTLENLGHAGVIVNDLDFLNERVGFGAGDSGRIISTNVYGNLWSPVLDPVIVADHITNVYFESDVKGYMQTSNTRPSLTYKTIDGGLSWNLFNDFDTTFFDIQKFYVTPNERFTYILDVNDSLYKLEADTIFSTLTNVRDFTFINDNEGWYIDSTSLYKITVNDTAWVLIHEFENYPPLNTVFFRDRRLGVITGDYGKILKTFDGGLSWRDISVAGEHVTAAYFEDANYGYAGDIEGGFYSTYNGGTTWIKRTTNGSGQIGFIRFYNYLSGFAVGEDGLYITTDGGSNLQLFDSPLLEETGNEQKTPSIYARLVNPNHLVYARGKNILVAKDIKQISVTNLHIDSYSDITPNKFELSQNYPNPFNAQTTITYTIPEAAHVSIKIYDTLGRLVSTGENSVKDAGRHKLVYNASDLSSGIYLVTIHAGNWYSAKKMVLLK